MPIPSPRSDEEEQAFISRCMGEIAGEYGQDQASAICYDKWESRDEDEEDDKQVLLMEQIMEEEWPVPGAEESEDRFFARCIPQMIEDDEVEQSVAERRCAAIWEAMGEKQFEINWLKLVD